MGKEVVIKEKRKKATNSLMGPFKIRPKVIGVPVAVAILLTLILALSGVASAQEIRFTGTVTGTNPPEQFGALWWNVTVEELISGPQTSCDTLRVELIISPPIGDYESNISVEDRVEVYGNYTSNCIVSLNGVSYYIVVDPTVHNLNTSDGFATIQAAIDDPDTEDGHTILVESGTYHESVNVPKRLILRGNDTGGGQPVVDADGVGSAITLSHDGIVLEGFTAVNTSSYTAAGIFVYLNNNTVINCTASNNYHGIYLAGSNTNNLTGNTASNNTYGIFLRYSSYNHLTGNTVSDNHHSGIYLDYSSYNHLTGNTASDNHHSGISVSQSNNNHIYNNYFDNAINARDYGTNIWNISKTPGTNIIGGPYLGGNYWSDYTGTDTNCDGIGNTKRPYNSSGGIQNGGDWLPLVKPHVFDTREGTYPSIGGTHNGTITPFCDVNISKMYTYPCPGTGGHTEYAAILHSNGTVLAEAYWNGYSGDWHNISFNNSFTLYANETYNFTIVTGSYPQIIHEREFNATGGTITCTSFEDPNGNIHTDWIPAIRLE